MFVNGECHLATATVNLTKLLVFEIKRQYPTLDKVKFMYIIRVFTVLLSQSRQYLHRIRHYK
jgi:hypothetical protein